MWPEQNKKGLHVSIEQGIVGCLKRLEHYQRLRVEAVEDTWQHLQDLPVQLPPHRPPPLSTPGPPFLIRPLLICSDEMQHGLLIKDQACLCSA